MTFEQFDKFSDALIADIKAMRDSKGKEYARDNQDRFGNFNRLAIRLNIPREKVALVYLTKHLEAIESYMDHHREFSTETIRGRCVDAMTYISLIAGMFEENSIEEGEARTFKSQLETMTPDRKYLTCADCGHIETEDEREYSRGCRCGGKWLEMVEVPYHPD